MGHVNDTIASRERFVLCMNSEDLNWRRVNADGTTTIQNSPEERFYTIETDGTCTYQEVPAATKQELPFTFVDIDFDAEFKARDSTPDTQVAANRWDHDRPTEPPFPAEL